MIFKYLPVLLLAAWVNIGIAHQLDGEFERVGGGEPSISVKSHNSIVTVDFNIEGEEADRVSGYVTSNVVMNKSNSCNDKKVFQVQAICLLHSTKYPKFCRVAKGYYQVKAEDDPNAKDTRCLHNTYGYVLFGRQSIAQAMRKIK